MLAGDGPQIVSVTPTLVMNESFDHLDVAFDVDIDATSFTASDMTIVGPGGVVAATSVEASARPSFGCRSPPSRSVGTTGPPSAPRSPTRPAA